MRFNKQKMIDKLEHAKSIVCGVHDKTDNDEVGDVMCFIDEAVASIKNS